MAGLIAPEGAGASRIHVLSPELANQIAAGEVVERPASVVKELCENAVDAGARRIEVEAEAGGRRLIRVVDDGCGMTPDEARLALRRHATSKIVSADDLWTLGTFGFRGEALPSIAAVSRLTVRTKVPGAEAGFQLVVEAGVETSAQEVGMPDGTQIEMRDLFYNTPARQKFLKSESTEAANIAEAVLRLALAHPEVHFKLRQNGRNALDLPVQRELGERVRAALSRRGAGVLHEALGEEGGHHVRAFLAGPEEASGTARSTFLFVGRRFVRDRSLLAALAMGYGEILEKGRYPLAALFVDVPGQDLDINVHPQKLEVRFARAQEVYAAVRHVVASAIGRAPWLTSSVMHTYSLPPEQASAPDRRAGGMSAANMTFPPPMARADAARDAEADVDLGQSTHGTFFANLEYIGQLHRTYLICQGRDELILVDQHAGHERVAFQRLRVAHRKRGIAHQRLLFPIPVEVDEAAAAQARSPEAQALLQGLGFELEAFGPTTLLVRAVPDLLRNVDPKPLVTDVLARLAEGAPAAPDDEPLDHIFATMACHSVVRAGDLLGREQAVALLGQLDAVDLRSHCPHGRPVVLRLPINEIERRFGRT